jgi:hypothetical protein
MRRTRVKSGTLLKLFPRGISFRHSGSRNTAAEATNLQSYRRRERNIGDGRTLALIKLQEEKEEKDNDCRDHNPRVWSPSGVAVRWRRKKVCAVSSGARETQCKKRRQ